LGLLPICRDAQAYPLLLISHLAQHTQNLGKDPRCSLTLIRSEHADVLQWTRLSCLAEVEPVNTGKALERYCRYFPDGRHYHKELNFNLYRLRPKRFYLISGFGSARWYDASRILDTPHLHTAAELEILYQINAHDHELLKRLLIHRDMRIPEQIQAVGADPQGLDVRLGEHLTRLHFSRPITDESRFVALMEDAITD
jgi:hypothetical protein